MNDGALLVARLPTGQTAKSADWLTDDHDRRYQATDPLDLPEGVLDRVYELYRKAYARLSPRPLISERDQLLTYNRWILLVSGPSSPRRTPAPEKIDGFALLKVKDAGLKVGLLATDGSPDAKRALVRFAIRCYNTPGVFGEVSPPLETRIAGEVPIVPFRDAIRILKRLGKVDVRKTWGEHYKRRIGRLGVIEKLMVGRPAQSL